MLAYFKVISYWLFVHRRIQKTTNPQSQTRNQSGFTLIELMITISIIAIISAIGIVNYAQAQKLARDARRKQDLRSIAIALEVYRQKNGRYPCHVNGISSSDLVNFWITDSEYTNCNPTATSAVPLDTNYINQMPKDPLSNSVSLGNGATPDVYGYSYTTPNSCVSPYPSTPGRFYTLRTRLENKNDPETCKIKQYKSCDNLIICGAGSESKNDLFIITSE